MAEAAVIVVPGARVTAEDPRDHLRNQFPAFWLPDTGAICR